jgi:hypothetical protein
MLLNLNTPIQTSHSVLLYPYYTLCPTDFFYRNQRTSNKIFNSFIRILYNQFYHTVVKFALMHYTVLYLEEKINAYYNQIVVYIYICMCGSPHIHIYIYSHKLLYLKINQFDIRHSGFSYSLNL